MNMLSHAPNLRIARDWLLIFALLLPTAVSRASNAHSADHATAPAPPVAGEAAEAKGKNKPSTRNEPAAPPQPNAVPSPSEIDPALRNTSQVLATHNIIEGGSTEPGSSLLADLQAMLDWGKKTKQEKNFTAAETAFSYVLKANAPPEMHRTAMLELALIAQENQQSARAQQIYTQYLERFSDDPSAAEIYLRQGLLFRQMGAPTMALSKFYAVMTTALRLKLDRLDYYQRLVLQAQTEIADTYYLQGKFGEAAEFLGRLLKLDSPQLNKAQVLYKLIRSQSALNHHPEVIAQAEFFLARYPDYSDVAEVRFLFADSLKKQGRTRDALQQVLILLESQQTKATNQPGNWVYWQQRTGNEIANQLYKEGDYLSALEIYRNLAQLDSTPPWQLPVWYQMGLIYERMMQPQKANEMYERILGRQKELDSRTRSPSLDTVLDMARWRKQTLRWQAQTETNKVVVPIRPADVALRAK